MTSDNSLDCARRDRDLASMIEKFTAPVQPDQPFLALPGFGDAAELLRSCADDPNVARLEPGQMISLYSSVRLVFGLLMAACVAGQGAVMSEMQARASMRGLGGLVERWAKAPDIRFASNAYEQEVDLLAEYFGTLLKGVLLLEQVSTKRLQSIAMGAAERDSVTFHILNHPINPLATRSTTGRGA